MVRSEEYKEDHPYDSKKWKRINEREKAKQKPLLRNWNDGTDVIERPRIINS